MVRDLRIKTVIFEAFTVNGSVEPNTFNSHMNGEILKVSVSSASSPGSLWISESGTNIEFYRRNGITSGTVAFQAHPRRQIVNETDVTQGFGSGNIWVSEIVQGPIFFAMSGLTSGTDKSFGPITVYYRWAKYMVLDWVTMKIPY